MVTVYDLEGNAIRLDGVDARDYIATGRYTAEPLGSAQAAADEAVRKVAAEVMTPENNPSAIREAAKPRAKKGG